MNCKNCDKPIEFLPQISFEGLQWRHKSGFYGCNEQAPSHSSAMAEPHKGVFKSKEAIKFVAAKNLIMRGSTRIGEMCSATMAKRTAKALNSHQGIFIACPFCNPPADQPRE